MEKQPLIRIDGVFESDHVNATDLSGTVTNEFGSLFSLFPGSDWFLFGGVAIQADPCDNCGGSGDVPLTGSAAEVALTEQILGGPSVEDCPKCRGLGVIPRRGSVEGFPEMVLIDAVFNSWPKTGLVLVVPIEGGNPPAII